VIVVMPAFKNVATWPFIVAVLVSEEVKLHVPVDVEVGGWITKDDAALFCAVTSGKVPSVGVGPCTVKVMVAIPGA
jgi:hypothetical protein